MDPRDSTLKSFAAALAGELTRKEGQTALQIMQRLGLVAEDDGVPDPAPRQGVIGIWEPRTEDGRTRYERSEERRAEWDLWADISEIPPKGDRKRVILLGESVARGYFYDPRYTPGQVLAELLSSAGVPGGVEVVDLAKNDLGAQELGALLQAALALQPDAFVLFAGNNWAQAPSVFREGLERHLAATALRQRGAPGLKTWLAERMASEVRQRLRGLLAPLSEQLPVVLLVPEFNLADWHLDGEADAPWLPDGLNARWLACEDAARRALAEDRIEEAEGHARKMIDIDRGAAATGLTILADCLWRRGVKDEARKLLERARDAHGWDSTPQVPKTLSVVQEALREGGGRIAVVDLPRVLEKFLDGELPNRKAFLDYCHLTSWGIRTAMAAAAEPLLRMLGAEPVGRDALSARTTPPDPKLEAEARFAAAIHNAHWGQPYGIVRHHCDEALRSCPGIAEAMECFLDLQVRQAPAWACESFRRLSCLGEGLLLRYVSTYSQGKLFDAILLEAIADALEDSGSPGRERLATLRQAESAVAAGRPVNYLSPYYRASWADRSGLWWSSFFYRAYDRVSRFPLVSAADRPVVLELTWRSPEGAQNGGEGAVLINGVPVGTLHPEPHWRTQRFVVDPRHLDRGVNSLELRWPLALVAGTAGIQQSALDLERGFPYVLLPVFAEVHSFKASVSRVTETSAVHRKDARTAPEAEGIRR